MFSSELMYHIASTECYLQRNVLLIDLLNSRTSLDRNRSTFMQVNDWAHNQNRVQLNNNYSDFRDFSKKIGGMREREDSGMSLLPLVIPANHGKPKNKERIASFDRLRSRKLSLSQRQCISARRNIPFHIHMMYIQPVLYSHNLYISTEWV